MENVDCLPTTLNVEGLVYAVTEELLDILFSQFGKCLECKITREIGKDSQAIVRFAEHEEAQAALKAMDKRNLIGQEMKVTWAVQSGDTELLTSEQASGCTTAEDCFESTLN